MYLSRWYLSASLCLPSNAIWRKRTRSPTPISLADGLWSCLLLFEFAARLRFTTSSDLWSASACSCIKILIPLLSRPVQQLVYRDRGFPTKHKSIGGVSRHSVGRTVINKQQVRQHPRPFPPVFRLQWSNHGTKGAVESFDLSVTLRVIRGGLGFCNPIE